MANQVDKQTLQTIAIRLLMAMSKTSDDDVLLNWVEDFKEDVLKGLNVPEETYLKMFSFSEIAKVLANEVNVELGETKESETDDEATDVEDE